MSELNQSEPAAAGKPNDPTGVTDVTALAGEPLEGSGFEEEAPDPDFDWRD